MKPSESFWASLRCDGGGPGGGLTSDRSREGLVPLAVPGTSASEICDELAVTPLVPFVGEAGLRGGGDSARDESRLSRDGDSLRFPEEARGEGLGRPSLLPELRPKGTNPPLDGEGALLKPPCMLWRRLPIIVPNRLFRFSVQKISRIRVEV